MLLESEGRKEDMFFCELDFVACFLLQSQHVSKKDVLRG